MSSFKFSFCETYKDTLENFEDKFNEVTVSLDDGKVGVHPMYFIMGNQFTKDLLLQTQEISRIIIPDFKVQTFKTLLHLIVNGEVHLDNNDETESILCLAELLYGMTLETFACNHLRIYNVERKGGKRIVHSIRNSKEHACQFCTRKFYSKTSAFRHRKICNKNPRKHDNKFKCHQCNHSVKTKEGLDAHVIAKHGLKQLFKCLTPDCKKEYKNLTSLKRHCRLENHKNPLEEGPLNEHENKWKEQCKVCHQFVWTWGMEYHMEKHENESKKYACHLCDYKSNRKDNLDRHKVSRHQIVNIDLEAIRNFPIEDEIYRCGECEMELSDEEEIEYHMSLKSCKRLTCEYCNKTFTMKANLKQHVKKFHKKK